MYLLIGAAIYFFFIRKPEIEEKKERKEDEKTDEELIMCDKCKTFYPKSEIKKIDGKNVCKDCYANS
jgi:formylmethanofuran dehydrogenase subunit E